jgi:hypothetical protein
MDSASNSDIKGLEKAAKDNALTLILFAFFCTWWAKSIGRSALGWFQYFSNRFLCLAAPSKHQLLQELLA